MLESVAHIPSFLKFLPGRGAVEIDILEVLPGSYGPNYKEDKVPPKLACLRRVWQLWYGRTTGKLWFFCEIWNIILVIYGNIKIQFTTIWKSLRFGILDVWCLGKDVMNQGGGGQGGPQNPFHRRWTLESASLKAMCFIPSLTCHGHICLKLSFSGVLIFDKLYLNEWGNYPIWTNQVINTSVKRAEVTPSGGLVK